jgi:hypothetical protein
MEKRVEGPSIGLGHDENSNEAGECQAVEEHEAEN